MHKKEKDVLAVLGLIFSILLCVATMYYTLNNTSMIADSDNVAGGIVNQNNIINNADNKNEDIELRNTAKKYADRIVYALVIKNDYDYLYNTFNTNVQKEYFDNDIYKCREKLELMFGNIGKASKFTNTSQIISSNKDMITCYYSVTYQIKKKTMINVLQIYLKITKNKLTLNGIFHQPI